MVFNREKLFYCFKNICKNQWNSVDIYFPYIRVSIHGHVQNIGQIPQKPFLDISSFWNIYKGNILQKFQENSSMSHMICLMIWTSIMSWRIVQPHEISSKPLLSFFKTLHCQTCPNALKLGAHAQMV